jgi:hypothetical protein
VVPANPRPDETLIRALARAHRWQRLLDQRRFQSAGELAEAEGVTRSFVNRLLRLTLLAPDTVEAILDGRQPKAMQLEEVTDAVLSEWEKQPEDSFVRRRVSAWGRAIANRGRALLAKCVTLRVAGCRRAQRLLLTTERKPQPQARQASGWSESVNAV